MLTLDRWREFLTTPKTLILPHMELIGFDPEPPIVVGSGEIQMSSPHEFTFNLSGAPSNIPYALSEINRQRENIYDANARFRLIGTDDKGINWMGGWTFPRIDMRQKRWILAGELQALSVVDRSDTVSREAGAELIFYLRTGDPMAIHLSRYVRSDRPSDILSREYEFEALGSKIRFVYEPTSTLLISASQSADLSPPFAENWLGEPLRVLFGQPIYPRLVARNFGDGRAAVSIRPSPPLVPSARWLALWRMHDELSKDNAAFWSSYVGLLALIARERDEGGNSNFEAHKITRLYDECIEASRVTRWVWALTIASSIEALAKLLDKKHKPTRRNVAPASDREVAIMELVSHIDALAGDNALKKIATKALRRLLNPPKGMRRMLRDLSNSGVVTVEQWAAWEEIRNEVMHGGLVSHYSTKEEDAKLLLLGEMLHGLTRELIVAASPGSTSA
jgi:hypothetical protein